MTINCNICSKSIDVFHVFPRKALFNKPLRSSIPDATVDMKLGYCEACRHITSSFEANARSKDLEKMIYGELYESFTPTTYSPFQQRYTDFIGQWLERQLPAKSNVLEIGSHDGYFLNIFHQKGHKVTGVEPSPFADVCKTNHPFPVVKDFFKPGDFKDQKFDLIVARHVLEHVSDPRGFMQGIADLLPENGLAYIEVPNSFISLEQCYFPEFHVDHISYFTMPSLTQLLMNVGLTDFIHIESIYAYMKFPFIGAFVRKTSSKPAVVPSQWFMDFSMPQILKKFTASFKRYEDNIRKLTKGNQLAVWGSGSCGTQFAIDAGWSTDTVAYVDPNNMNQNKVLSVTGHKVLSPESLTANNCSAVLVASGWEDDVKRQVQSTLKFNPKTFCLSDLIKE